MSRRHSLRGSHRVLRERLFSPEDDFEKRRASEWSEGFERLMRNRLLVGSYRYGLLHDKTKQFDRVAYIKVKMQRYEETGNVEALVDVANLALIEYVKGEHPKRHFKALDDVEEHAT